MRSAIIFSFLALVNIESILELMKCLVLPDDFDGIGLTPLAREMTRLPISAKSECLEGVGLTPLVLWVGLVCLSEGVGLTPLLGVRLGSFDIENVFES